MGRLVLGVLAALAFALALGAPNSTARGKGDSTCPTGKLCVWTGANYTGDRLLIGTRKLSNKIYDAMNDDVESLKLRKSGAAVLYADFAGEGPYRVFGCNGENRKVPDLGDDAWQFANTASSSRIRKSTDPNECDAP